MKVDRLREFGEVPVVPEPLGEVVLVKLPSADAGEYKFSLCSSEIKVTLVIMDALSSKCLELLQRHPRCRKEEAVRDHLRGRTSPYLR